MLELRKLHTEPKDKFSDPVQLGCVCLVLEWEGCSWYSFEKWIKEKLLLEIIVCLLKIYNPSGMILAVGVKGHTSYILNKGAVNVSVMLCNLYNYLGLWWKWISTARPKWHFMCFCWWIWKGKKQTFSCHWTDCSHMIFPTLMWLTEKEASLVL